MVIWRGWGIVSPLIGLAGAWLGALLFAGPYQRYAAGGGLLAAAVANWYIGQSLNGPLRRAEFDRGHRHSLFWIPMEWWSLPMLVIAALGSAGVLR